MKVKKYIGVTLTCLGFIAAFIGLAATVLPMIQNSQLQLVLSSFSAPSGNGLVNLMNVAMSYALTHCYLVLFSGLGAGLLGVLALASCTGGEEAPVSRPSAAAAPFRGEISAWRSSKAGRVLPDNPFANPALGESSFLQGAEDRNAFPSQPAAAPLQTFAPLTSGAPSAAPTASPWKPEAAYTRPRSESPQPSPYARPSDAPASELEKDTFVYEERPIGGVSPAASAPAAPVQRPLSSQPSYAVPAAPIGFAAPPPPASPLSVPPAVANPVSSISPATADQPLPSSRPLMTPPVARTAPSPAGKKTVKIKSTMGKHTC